MLPSGCNRWRPPVAPTLRVLRRQLEVGDFKRLHDDRGTWSCSRTWPEWSVGGLPAAALAHGLHATNSPCQGTRRWGSGCCTRHPDLRRVLSSANVKFETNQPSSCTPSTIFPLRLANLCATSVVLMTLFPQSASPSLVATRFDEISAQFNGPSSVVTDVLSPMACRPRAGG